MSQAQKMAAQVEAMMHQARTPAMRTYYMAWLLNIRKTLATAR